ncbi:MAG: hypothetical protein DRH08_11625 [Deltaproteobacteria bacterium]|nr:MAG: hypothetical protein DRH08_11625 [Deltaproteobacteria bacterium]
MGEKSSFATGGLEVDGLSGSITALRRFDRDAANELRRVMRANTNDIRDTSRRRMMGRPFGGTYSRRAAQIRSVTNQTSASIKLMRSLYNHTAVGAELGSYVSQVFGRPMSNKEIARPHYAQYRGFPDRLDKGSVGTAVLPAIRAELPRWEDETANGALRVVTKLLKVEGVETHTTVKRGT